MDKKNTIFIMCNLYLPNFKFSKLKLLRCIVEQLDVKQIVSP